MAEKAGNLASSRFSYSETVGLGRIRDSSPTRASTVTRKTMAPWQART